MSLAPPKALNLYKIFQEWVREIDFVGSFALDNSVRFPPLFFSSV